MMNNENTNNNTEMAVIPTPIEEVEVLTALTPAEFENPKVSQMYCSIINDGTFESKTKIFNAVNSPAKKVQDVIGQVINLKDFIVHQIELIDENTGELIKPLRIVLVDDKGVSYEAVSGGVANALSRIVQIFGQPATWDKPIKVKPILKSTRNGNNKVTTLEVIA